MNTFTVGGDNQFSFLISYDTEPDWDFVFVELAGRGRTTGSRCPRRTAHQAERHESTGESCPEGWFELHPWLEQYQGADCSGDGLERRLGPVAGLDGVGRSTCRRMRGQRSTVSISYASDWAAQGLGVWVDDIQVPGAAADTDFESGLDGWTVGDPTRDRQRRQPPRLDPDRPTSGSPRAR